MDNHHDYRSVPNVVVDHKKGNGYLSVLIFLYYFHVVQRICLLSNGIVDHVVTYNTVMKNSVNKPIVSIVDNTVKLCIIKRKEMILHCHQHQNCSRTLQYGKIRKHRCRCRII